MKGFGVNGTAGTKNKSYTRLIHCHAGPAMLAKHLFISLAACLAIACTPAFGQQKGGLRIPGLFAVKCQAIAYEPAQVYDAPHGLRIGQLVLDHPEYALKTRASCNYQPLVYLRPEGRQTLVDVGLTEVSLDEPALSVYETTSHQGELWVQGRTATGAFWLPVAPPRQYLSLEQDLVQGLALFTETCDDMGRCLPATEAMTRLVSAAGLERVESCSQTAYDISELFVLPDGRRAYRVRLAESLLPKFQKKLPSTAVVPVRARRQ